MAYHLAPSLAQLRAEVNARWPHRDKGSDGWIGDTAHGARTSDHNPDYSAGGVVRAIDIDKDGIDVNVLLTMVVGDARTAYVIWNRRIWVRGSGWSAYKGANGHTAHVHVSIRHGSVFERATAPWGTVSSVSTPVGGATGIASRPTLAAPTIPTPIPAPPLEDDMARLIRHPNGSIALVGPGPQMRVLHTVTEVEALRATGQATGETIQLPNPLIWTTCAAVAQRAGTYSA